MPIRRKRPTVRPRTLRRFVVSVLAVLAGSAMAGCAADRELHVELDETVQRPRPAAVVFFIDSLGKAEFERLLAEGALPNIRKHLVERGVSVEHAVTCIPSITYAVSTSLITGRFPGRHGVVSNKWYEPSTGRFQNYCSINTYQLVDADYAETPTLYDVLGDRCTVSIQTAIRRGVFHTIDNWATSGINWFFENKTGVDCLVAQRLELIADRSRQWGRWPDLIWAYFPATDERGHEFGPGSPERLETLVNVDRQIGHMCKALKDVGLYDDTYLVLVSDHGMTSVKPHSVFDISRHLTVATGARVWSNGSVPPGGPPDLRRDYDYAVATTASRWCAVYPLPNAMTKPDMGAAFLPAALAEIEADLENNQAAHLPHDRLPPWLSAAIEHPAVELCAVSFVPNRIHTFTKAGYALIVRSADPAERHVVRQRRGSAIFEHAEASVGTNGSDSRRWLEMTIDDRYPDFIPQIAAYFEHERSGNIVFFAADGWDFSMDDPHGGHGSILPGDMMVPMVFAGPGISKDISVPVARNTDVMPTLVHLLGAPMQLEDGTHVDTDGVNLLPSVKPAFVD